MHNHLRYAGFKLRKNGFATGSVEPMDGTVKRFDRRLFSRWFKGPCRAYLISSDGLSIPCGTMVLRESIAENLWFANGPNGRGCLNSGLGRHSRA